MITGLPVEYGPSVLVSSASASYHYRSMRRSRRPDSTVHDAARDGGTESPAGESAFDAAQNLLKAALDEVQTATTRADEVKGTTPDLTGAASNGPQRVPQSETEAFEPWPEA